MTTRLPVLDLAAASLAFLIVSTAHAEVPQLVTDLRPGAPSGVPFLEAAVFGGKLYFNGDSDGGAADLWVLEGAGPPTVVPGTTGVEPTDLIVFQGALYFQGGPFTPEDRELWKYDGASPAFEVLDLEPSGSSRPYAFAVFGDRLCFQATTASIGAELRCWDGIAPPVAYDLWSGVQSSGVEDLTVIADLLFFSGYPGPAAGRELGVFDGASFPVMTSLVPGNVGSAPSDFTRVGPSIYFAAEDPAVDARRVWRYDVATETATIVLPQLAVQGGLTRFGTSLLAVGESAASGEAKLHGWNGTGLEVLQTADTAWEAQSFVLLGSDLFFLAESETASFDLLVFDGEDVRRVLDGELFDYFLTPRLASLGGRVFFSVDQDPTGGELWWIESSAYVFGDGFESGDASAWSP